MELVKKKSTQYKTSKSVNAERETSVNATKALDLNEINIHSRYPNCPVV